MWWTVLAGGAAAALIVGSLLGLWILDLLSDENGQLQVPWLARAFDGDFWEDGEPGDLPEVTRREPVYAVSDGGELGV